MNKSINPGKALFPPGNNILNRHTTAKSKEHSEFEFMNNMLNPGALEGPMCNLFTRLWTRGANPGLARGDYVSSFTSKCMGKVEGSMYILKNAGCGQPVIYITESARNSLGGTSLGGPGVHEPI